MKAEERIIIVKGEEKVVTLTGMWDTTLKFLGSSCPASVHPGEVVSSLTLVVGEEPSVVAVETQRPIQTGKYRNTECGYFLFQVTSEGKIVDPLVPKPDRIGQIVPEVGLTVRIGDEFFLSPLLISGYRVEENMAKLSAQYRNVGTANANLLCRFMAGKAEAGDVRKVAEELFVQTVDVPMLQKKLADAEKQVGALEQERARISQELRNCHSARNAEVEEIELELDRVKRLYGSFVVAVNGLIHAPAKNFFAGRAANRVKLISELVRLHQKETNGQPK